MIGQIGASEMPDLHAIICCSNKLFSVVWDYFLLLLWLVVRTHKHFGMTMPASNFFWDCSWGKASTHSSLGELLELLGQLIRVPKE